MQYDKSLGDWLDHEHTNYAQKDHSHPELDKTKEINAIRELAKRPVPYEHTHPEYETRVEAERKTSGIINAFDGLIKGIVNTIDSQIKDIRESISKTVESLTKRIAGLESRIETKSPLGHSHGDLETKIEGVNNVVAEVSKKLKQELDTLSKDLDSKNPLLRDFEIELKALSDRIGEYTKQDETIKIKEDYNSLIDGLGQKIKDVEIALDALTKIDKKDKQGLVELLRGKADKNHKHTEYANKDHKHKEYASKSDIPVLPKILDEIPETLSKQNFEQLEWELAKLGHAHKISDVRGLEGYLDSLYLRLDTANDPLTGQLQFPVDGFKMNDGTNNWTVTINTDGAIVTTVSDTEVLLEDGSFFTLEDNTTLLLEL